MKITERQQDVLKYLRRVHIAQSGYDGSVLEALRKKGLVLRHSNTAPGYIYYTWTLTDAGKSRDIKE